jgi:hypothetical protein
MTAANKVGGDVDAFCPRDALVLNHTILAMVGPKIAKVRCNTCKREGAFRRGPPGDGAPTPRRPRERAARVEVPFEQLFAGKDIARARKWSMQEKFHSGDVMDHPAFGLGLVMEAPTPGKVQVAFRGGTKVIACGR